MLRALLSVMPTVKFHTFGCKVNQYETQLMREMLYSAGIREVDCDQPDIVVINGCSVTARAHRDSVSIIKKTLKFNPIAKIIACGCFVEFDSSAIKNLNDEIILIKNNQKQQILSYLNIKNIFLKKYITNFFGHSRAFVKVQDGCNNFCSYCIVPYLRGRSRSRNIKSILKEIESISGNGYNEIVLTGICLGEYGKDFKQKKDLSFLLREILKIKSDFRIRLSSIEFHNITKELVSLINSSDRICRHLHIPLQSGDDKILKSMNRHYRVKDFLLKIDEIRLKIPDIAISTDIIVGFPNEDDKSFLNCVRTVRRLRPMRMHIFTYSKRPLTEAGRINTNLSNGMQIKQRKLELAQLADDLAIDYYNSFLGKKLEVLVESRNKSGYYTGYTGNYIYTNFKSKLIKKGLLQPVVLERVTQKSTFSKPIC